MQAVTFMSKCYLLHCLIIISTQVVLVVCDYCVYLQFPDSNMKMCLLNMHWTCASFSPSAIQKSLPTSSTPSTSRICLPASLLFPKIKFGLWVVAVD